MWAREGEENSQGLQREGEFMATCTQKTRPREQDRRKQSLGHRPGGGQPLPPSERQEGLPPLSLENKSLKFLRKVSKPCQADGPASEGGKKLKPAAPG